MSTGARDSAANSDSGAARPVTAATRTRTLGSLHEFRPDSEEFSTYMERVENTSPPTTSPRTKRYLFSECYWGEYLWGIA